jgi:hypothetical protein
MSSQIDKIKEYINNHYKASYCSYTVERSEGNYSDVFDDGAGYGMSWALYDIANIINMEIEEPEAGEYEDENE